MLAVLLFASTTFAEPTADTAAAPTSPDAKAALALVSHDLVQPLAAKEQNRSKFSRARMPAQARRIRILDEQPRQDTVGNAFVRFAIDARYAGFDDSHWRKDDITGCVYLGRKQAFVKIGEQHRPASFLLGKNVKPVDESTCQPAAAQLAQSN
jgi:hypothetical protein